MHTWGRVYAADGSWTWVKVGTDANGDNSMVYVTAMAQEIRLQKGESPFYADRGIDAKGSVMTQLWPDADLIDIQQQYSPYFASLKLSRDYTKTVPTYRIDAMTNYGVTVSTTIPV